jgi:hypothetical protein
MLLERAGALSSKMSSYHTLKSAADEAEQFLTRANQFSALSAKVARARAMFAKLAEVGVGTDFAVMDGSGYAIKARTLREAILANPATINSPPFDLKHEFTDRVLAIALEGEKAAATSWQSYVKKRAEFGADDVLSALAKIPQLRPSITRIGQIRTEVVRLGATLPDDLKGAISKLDALVVEHEEAWNALAADEIPHSVVTFIRSAASADALLSAYTPDVREWLEGRNLVDAFRIKLR